MNLDNMSELERIVVLMSTYNGEKYIKEQINSILSQKEVDVFLIVRDDGSSDHTIDILDEYKKSSTSFDYIKGDNCGSTKSFSKLLEYAYQKFNQNVLYSFADQDDVWLETKLYIASQKIDKKSAVPMLYCSNLTCVDRNLNYLHYMRKNIKAPYPKYCSLVEPIATGCTMVFNPEAARLYLLKYDTSVRMHDIFMSHIAAFIGDIIYDNQSYILYRQHGNNQIGKRIGFISIAKGKLKSMLSIRYQHLREIDAKTFLEKFREHLNKEDKEIIEVVANYRKSIKIRLSFLLGEKGRKIRRVFSPNIWLYLRIIIGRV